MHMCDSCSPEQLLPTYSVSIEDSCWGRESEPVTSRGRERNVWMHLKLRHQGQRFGCWAGWLGVSPLDTEQPKAAASVWPQA